MCHGTYASRHTWMSHGTYEWGTSHIKWREHPPVDIISHVAYKCVLSHIHASCHIWMRHVTYEQVTAYMHASRYMWLSHDTHERITRHIKWPSDMITRQSRSTSSCAIKERVTAHIMRHGTYRINGSRHIWVMSHDLVTSMKWPDHPPTSLQARHAP